MSLLDTASLVITPNGYKEGKLYSVVPSDGSGDLNVTRATTATRVNASGLVELVPYNIFSYSSSFSNAAWGKLNATVTGGQSGYDGTTNAFLVTDDSTNAVHLIAQTPIVSGQHTVSIYAKANTLNWLWLRGVQSSANVRAWFDLSTGTVGTVETNGTANIENVGNGWYRCELTIANHESGFEFYVGVTNANGATSYVGSGQSLYIQDAQLVEGSVAKDYQKTETRLNIPRLDYSNGTCPSILVEPQRTNIILYSQDFSSNWFKSGITTTPNSGTSPLGSNTATKYACTANGAYMFQTVVLQNAFTVSCFAKKINADWIWIGSNISGVGDFGASFNINTGAVGTIVGTGTTCSIEDYGNGWYRCIITKDFAGAVPLCVVVPLSGNNDFSNQSGKEYLIWGYQGEAGSYATSYIPTTSSSVTRNADVISKTGISSLIGQTSGTVFLDINIDSSFAQDDMRFLDISDGSSANWYFIGTNNTNEFRFYFKAGGSVISTLTPFTSGRNKMAFAYANNDYVIYINGVQIYSTTTATVGSTSELNLGKGFSGSSFKQFTNSVALWKTRLTNTQLASLTTI